MLTRPGWLTYSGRFTHISGHPSAAVQVEHRIGKVRRVKDQRSTAVPCSQTRLCQQESVAPMAKRYVALPFPSSVLHFFDQLLMTLVTSPLERCTVFRVRVNVKHGTERQTDSVTRNAAY